MKIFSSLLSLSSLSSLSTSLPLLSVYNSALRSASDRFATFEFDTVRKLRKKKLGKIEC